MLRLLIGIVMTCAGLWAVVTVFVPAWRPCWKGTRVSCGAVSLTGFGLTFTALGAAATLAAAEEDPAVPVIVGLTLIVSVPLVFLGNWLDFRWR